jgi:hypothetical protein
VELIYLAGHGKEYLEFIEVENISARERLSTFKNG